MLVEDLRHAWRRLKAKPANAALAIALLATGIGLATAMFTIVDALLLRPLPFADADRLSRVYMGNDFGGRTAVSSEVFRAWRHSPAFEATESALAATSVIESASGPIARGSADVSPGLFDMLGVTPIRGRLFTAEDGRLGAAPTVLVSEDLWRTALGGDRDVVGRALVIDGVQAHIIGVVPSDVRFPNWNSEVWRAVDFEGPQRPGQLPVTVVRFARAVPRADVLRLATDAAHQADPSTAKLVAKTSPITSPLRDRYNERALPLLGGAVALVFLVLCANVSSLLLVRFDERRREFSMCTALGASRARLLRQAFIESVALGVLGGVAGVVIAFALVSASRLLLPEAFLLRTLNPLNLDRRAFAVALAAGVVATIGSGWWPAWFGTRGLSIESLKGSSNSASFGTRTTRALTRSLVIAETAMACALLSGAVLVVRSFINLSNVERGLQTDGVVTASIQLPTAAFADPTARTAMTSLIEDTMRRLPGVQQVAFSFGLPPAGGTIQHGSNWRSSVTGAAPLDLEVESYDVGADFFDLYRIPIVRGRGIRSADTMRDVVIGERLAQLLWPNADPIGGSFTFAKEAYQVVGVAREINHPSVVASNDRPEYYRPIQADARARNYFMLSLRCDTRCPDGASIRYQLLQLNPAIVVVNVGPLDDAYFRQLAAPRAAAALAIVFAMVGVIAAAGGLFGVLSYTVGRRRRELGVRAAIGASRRDIRQLVLRDGLVTGVAGIAIGAAGSWWLARGLSAIQYGVSAGDPVSWLLVTLLLALTVFAAVWQPAVRAARVDPAQLLRQD